MQEDNQVTGVKIPKRIYPDNIRDAIVEIRYQSELPFEILLGVFFNALDETYFYVTRQNPVSPNTGANPQQITIQVGVQHIFYNDKISIQALPESFVFTCVGGKYIGWDVYFDEIKKAANVLIGDGTSSRIRTFKRVGVRYISDYPKVFLDECMKINFTFGMPEVKSDTYVFRTEFTYQNSRVILNLNNRLPIAHNQKEGEKSVIVPTSSIDIDVIKEPLQVFKIDEVYDKIEEAHHIEKVLFFSMLKEDYLKNLNPEY